MKEITVQAQRDHIMSLCTASPIQALSELIWNALDADALDVKVDVIQNALDGIDAIRVSDDGAGIDASQADVHFGNLGGSWKKDAFKTPVSGRVLHGRKGRGRFKAFALGNHVEWRTTMQTEGGLRSFVLSGEAANPGQFTLVEASAGPGPGTEVLISDIVNPMGSLLDAAWAVQQLASHFALYLKAYPNVRIYFQGLLVNPVIVQRADQTYHLRASDDAHADLQVIEWKSRQGRSKIVFCNADGFALHEIDAAIRPGSGFNYTAYLVSPRFVELHEENLLVLEDLHPEIKAFLDATRDTLRQHFRERRETLTAELLQQWQEEGTYPYSGDAADGAEVAQRLRFETCAL
ncbi:MAG: ATP-binding protein, partial [Kiritimatiellaeota bacterium]|nr:ATP-binding protein [Kiritimatiellota bacterium]